MIRSQLSLLVALGLLAGAAQAAQAPFYSLTEVASAADTGGNFGPWAIGMARDSSTAEAVLSRSSSNDWFSFFNMAPSDMDLAHRHRYELSCSYVLAGSVCTAYWDGMPNGAKQWRDDTLNYVSQTQSQLGGTSADEQDGILTRLGDSTAEAVGYKVAASPAAGANYHPRTGLARLPGVSGDLDLISEHQFTDVGGFASAYGLVKLADNRYLVGGTANTAVAGPDDALNKCYSGSNSASADYPLCPGFNTQATLWLVDPASGAVSTTVQASHYDQDNSGLLQTAAVQDLARVEGSLWAVGYSSRQGTDTGAAAGRNLAVVWPLDVSGDVVTVGTQQRIPLASGVPGEGDAALRHSWAVAINQNGWVIGNQQYDKVKGRNRPIEMFAYRLGSSSKVPFADQPAVGSNSEAAALNNQNQVVGWRDERNENQPVYQGSPRLQEAFLYNIDSGNSWRLNDLICGRDDAGASSCAIGGKYYYIAYANAINDDGSIAATAFRYDSQDDWAKRNNPTTVTVLLNKNAEFVAGDVPAERVVSNPLPRNDYGASDGGGALGAPWLVLLGLVGLGRVFRRVK